MLQYWHRGYAGLAGANGRSDGKMRWSLLVLALAWVILVPVPALSQPLQEGPSGAPYDQYGGQVPGVGGNAVRDAIAASGAIRASAEEPQAAEEEAPAADEDARAADEDAVSAAELPHATGGPDLASAATDETQEVSSSDSSSESSAASSSHLEELPDTGGLSPLWLVAPLLCAGIVLVRRILF